MKSILGTMLAVAVLLFALPVFADEFDISKFIGKPTTGGVACVSKKDAQEFVAISLEFAHATLETSGTRKETLATLVRMKEKIRSGTCRTNERYVPKRVESRFRYTLMILEAMGGEDFIVTMWVVTTPAELRPLIKVAPQHESEPPGWIEPPPRAPLFYE